jgi:hypothetical protein
MTKPEKTYRERMIEEQDDRNRRIRKPTNRERRRVGKSATAAFWCPPCERAVRISWRALDRDGGTPKCRECGGPLRVVTACLSKGVLPKQDGTR